MGEFAPDRHSACSGSVTSAMFAQSPRPTVHQLSHHHQSAFGSQRVWRQGGRTDEDYQFRPVPNPGPGRGSQLKDESAGRGDEVELGDGERGVASAGKRWDDQQCKDKSTKDDGFVEESVTSGQSESESAGGLGKHKTSSEEKVKKSIQPCRPGSENLLKPGRQVQHLSDISNSTDCCTNCSYSDLVKQLYKENQSLRVRVKAIETIAEIFENTKQELDTEKARNVKLVIAVSNLQHRLYKVGCDACVDLAEDEIFIPGPDRAFVNSVISENGKLQKELREWKKIDDGKTKLGQETTEEAQHQLRDLQEELDASTTKINKLEQLLCSSDDAKTAKIVHLEDASQRASKELKNAEDVCKMLNSEVERLQSDFASSKNRLEKAYKDVTFLKDQAEKNACKVTEVATQKMEVQKESNLNIADRLKIAVGQVSQLDRENSRLTEQLREVIGMNTRWQRYNEQRETHVLKLTKTNHHQQSKIIVLEQQQRDLEQTINGLNAMLQNLKDEQRKNTDAAILSLEHRLAQREDRISELAEELSALKVYIQNGEDERGVRQRQEDRDMIQTLQQQVKIYKDDFEQERRDRERIQGNNEILRHRLHDASRQLASFEQQSAHTPSNFTGKVIESAAIYQPTRRLVARGISRQGYGSDEGTYLPENVEVDAHDVPDGPTSTTEPLQCPRCTQEFAVADHSLFMRHVGTCLDQ